LKEEYSRKPFITAHSGCENTEANSLEYLNLAIESGVDIIEIDVNVTLDKIPVLIHDNCIFHNSEILKINETDYETLKKVKKGILKLDEALKIIKDNGKIANIDIKDIKNLYFIADTINRADAVENVFITGCNTYMAYQIKRDLPTLQVLLNVEMEYPNSSIEIKQKNREAFFNICNRAISNCCCGININYKDCNEEFVNYVRRRGLLIFVWTVDDIEMMKKFIRQGVDSITTNKVKALKELLVRYNDRE